jgi:hypothetical protein
MIAEKLAQLLGESLCEQVERALKGKGAGGRDADAAIVNDGEYLPADTVKAALVRAALEGQVHDPEDVLPLLDLTRLRLDEKGGLTGDLQAMVDEVRRNKPYLFLQPGLHGASPARPVNPGQAPLSGADLGRLSMEEYRRYRSGMNGFPAV